MLMPFGQYEGTPVRDLPLGYLLWLRRNVEVDNPALRRAVDRAYQEQLEQREMDERRVLRHLDPARLAEVTLYDIRNWWGYFAEVFRRQYYDVQLHEPEGFRIFHDRWILGWWVPAERLIGLTNRFILPYENFQNILLHEMCHQYVTDMRIKDSGPHGWRWRNIAARMGAAARSPVSITDDGLYAPSPLRPGDRSIVVYMPEDEKPLESLPELNVGELESAYDGFEDGWKSEFL